MMRASFFSNNQGNSLGNLELKHWRNAKHSKKPTLISFKRILLIPLINRLKKFSKNKLD